MGQKRMGQKRMGQKGMGQEEIEQKEIEQKGMVVTMTLLMKPGLRMMVLGFRLVLTMYRSRDMCLKSYACRNSLSTVYQGCSTHLGLPQYIEASMQYMHLQILPSIV